MEEACSNPSSDGAEGSLHEKYLRVLLYASISKAPTEFALFQQTCVCGVFSSTKVDTSEINVELLNTPIGQLQWMQYGILFTLLLWTRRREAQD
ncbi:hypothetical protein SeLEV6574_g02883 [Synchytrium endobioticum]|uniref:Uncharacterized protein n=1 Tax=Synchytrium endobioticum TaxID=286115 RepID=A0A507D6G2_9FUNG|nr:hypothetical protein SeLEV6574_g02883 [Synchytrium endobioticum]